MGEITQLLGAVRAGDKHALGRVFDMPYPELQRLARARIDAGERSLTALVLVLVLVHEAYLRLIGSATLDLNDRRHFMACAARVMRAIVNGHARRRRADKRGGDDRWLPISDADSRIDRRSGDAGARRSVAAPRHDQSAPALGALEHAAQLDARAQRARRWSSPSADSDQARCSIGSAVPPMRRRCAWPSSSACGTQD